MGLLSVISPAGDDELLPGHVVPAGRAVPFLLQRRWAVTSRLPARSGC
jgi:hypothetical protein